MTPTGFLRIEGNWWLPSDVRKVAGVLVSDDDGIRLELYRSLRSAVPDENGVTVGNFEWKSLPVIHGLSRAGKCVTLLGSSGLSGPAEDFAETYQVEAVLLDAHVEADEFTEAWADFDWLDIWLNPPSLEYEIESQTEVRVRESIVDLASIKLEGANITLRGGTTSNYSTRVVHAERYSALIVQASTPRDWKAILEEYIRPLQDFLTVALGHATKLTQMLVRVETPYEQSAYCRMYFDMIQMRSAGPPSPQSLDGYGAPTLVRFDQMGSSPAEVLQRWYALWTQHRTVFIQLMAPYNAPFMYGQHKFGAIFQAVEAWHKVKFSGKEASKLEHASRVKWITDAAVAAGIDTDTIAWAESVLRSRNDKKLAQKVEEVVRSTGGVGEVVLSAAPNFGARAAGARAGVAHPKNDPRSTYTASLFWHGEVLLWVMRTCLLNEVGLTDISDRVTSRLSFKHAVAEIEELT